ncbi:hypothetical protein ARMGADRAFT_945667, partial [Armillaria gallica]
CLFHLPVIPLFMFDGPHCPAYKHKKTVKKTPVWLTNDFKWLLEGFGFPYWEVLASSFHMSFLVLTRITGSR